MDAEENQKQVFPRRPQPLEIAARFPHSHRRDEAVEVENQKQVFPLSTATGWLFRPNSERRPGGGASLLLQAHCSIRKCSTPAPLQVKPARGSDQSTCTVARPGRHALPTTMARPRILSAVRSFWTAAPRRMP